VTLQAEEGTVVIAQNDEHDDVTPCMMM